MAQTKITARDVIILAEISSTADPAAPTYTGSYKPVGMATEVSLDEDFETQETSHKNSGTTKSFDYGMANASGSIKGLLFFGSSYVGADELKTAARAKKKVKMVLVTKKDSATIDESTAIPTADIDADKFLLGSTTETFEALITKVGRSAGNDGTATYDISFQVNGAITSGTVAAGS